MMNSQFWSGHLPRKLPRQRISGLCVEFASHKSILECHEQRPMSGAKTVTMRSKRHFGQKLERTYWYLLNVKTIRKTPKKEKKRTVLTTIKWKRKAHRRERAVNHQAQVRAAAMQVAQLTQAVVSIVMIAPTRTVMWPGDFLQACW